MFGSLGPGEIILILVVLLLVFGAKRLPELGGALGKGIREFRSSVKDIEKQVSGDDQPPQQQAMQPPPRSQAIPQPPPQQSAQQPAQQEPAQQQPSAQSQTDGKSEQG